MHRANSLILQTIDISVVHADVAAASLFSDLLHCRRDQSQCARPLPKKNHVLVYDFRSHFALMTESNGMKVVMNLAETVYAFCTARQRSGVVAQQKEL